MGISGLLPALKSIQVTRHISEYSGKTVAVDAYVWLHRGVYSCATELATGKITHKYVDYAMHRVRLLQHHGITPYIVFDGGPLPAKKGTESDRKSKREENLARGKAFMAQGKMSQARECFIKCVDVSPEMAYQLIKALRAESVAYVVAPYEADAQLAYLEKAGFVDAILTEDSDLLVFGCQTVLFKLDSVAATVVSISREDFGSVTASSGEPNSISLIGWSDVQFRGMTILSGCDYLPSIPGIGLKTACNLLKKWKTAEAVIRAIGIKGKKAVPIGYLKKFQLAEQCFLHQRVFCPRQERLVYLSDVGPDWNDESDAYVGDDIDPALAKSIALGNHDPATHLPIKDINPGFLPRTLKPLHTDSNTLSTSSKAKGKMRQSMSTPPTKPSGGILSFFGPNPIIPSAGAQTRPKVGPIPVKHGVSAGKASGKRTLSEVMDQDLGQKKRHRYSHSPLKSAQSRFFSAHGDATSGGVGRRHSDGVMPITGPSRLQAAGAGGENKENMYVAADGAGELVETSEPELDVSDLSLRAQIDDIDSDGRLNLNVAQFPDAVEQEDGYISPSPSCSKDVQDLSSPPGPSRRQRVVSLTGVIPSDEEDDADADFGADAISSPISVKKPKPRSRFQAEKTPTRWIAKSKSKFVGDGQVLVEPTPSPGAKEELRLYPDIDKVPSPTLFRGPDLRDVLGGDDETVLEFNANGKPKSASRSASPPSPSPETPNFAQQQTAQLVDVVDVDDLDDEDDARRKEGEMATNAVMAGWRQRWALPSKTPVQARRLSQQAQPMTTPRYPLRPSSPNGKKAKAFTMGSSRTGQTFHLRRSDTNVTPAGRHTMAVYKPPRSAPSKLSTTKMGNSNTALNLPNVKLLSKPRRNLLLFEAVKQNAGGGSSSSASVGRQQKSRQTIDLTLDDDFDFDDIDPAVLNDKEVASSARARLAQFRCS